MSTRTLEVLATWDDEAKVWVAESEDVPGLVAEAESEDQLVRKLETLVPELLELNNVPFNRPLEARIKFCREERICLTVAA
jgi:predicted RNase H-like HicB family nuclease